MSWTVQPGVAGTGVSASASVTIAVMRVRAAAYSAPRSGSMRGIYDGDLAGSTAAGVVTW